MCCYRIAQVISRQYQLLNEDKLPPEAFFDTFLMRQMLPEELYAVCREFYRQYARCYTKTNSDNLHQA